MKPQPTTHERHRLQYAWLDIGHRRTTIHHPGFTLIEQVLSLFTLVIVMAIVGNLFIVGSRFSADEATRIEVGESAARILSTVDDTLREGRAIIASATINGTTYTTGKDVVVLTLPSIVNDQPTGSNDTVVIYRDAATNQLIQRTAADPSSSRVSGPVQVGTDVGQVYFRYTTNDPTSSTAVTVLVGTTQKLRTTTYTKYVLLYETLRNHP
jgi:hypothetical protein